jgi:hypothetical protein
VKGFRLKADEVSVACPPHLTDPSSRRKKQIPEPA